jgi:Transposase and inactivated derivatives
MSNTYTQLYLHFVFGVKFRQSVIHKAWKERLHQYITAIIQRNQHKMLQINSMPDHIHILIGYNPNQSVASLLQLVKSESTKWINEQRFVPGRFAWQEGYGAFSYSKSQVQEVIRYIQLQEEHHKKTTFREEYRAFLNAFEIEFDERFIFKELV